MSWNDHPDFDPCVGCGLGAVEQYHGQWWCAGCVRDEKNAHASKPPLARITGVLGEERSGHLRTTGVVHTDEQDVGD